ncbi:hypothetical protein BBJ28_00024813 [Nothophytophthora sp. Chile5]|nr:hypothetical protein BBJ28_00024813 [Nothophytophthora sp. Chile5]
MRRLPNELLGLRDVNFETHLNAEDLLSVPVPHGDHSLVNTADFYVTDAQNKRRQYLRKVCSAFASSKSYETSYYCQACCAYFADRVPLCRQVRRVESGNTLTCAQVWHDTWNDGKNIPPNLKKIRFRSGKRKRAQSDEEEESNYKRTELHNTYPIAYSTDPVA